MLGRVIFRYLVVSAIAVAGLHSYGENRDFATICAVSRYRNFNELWAKMWPECQSRVKTEADTLRREYVFLPIRRQVGFMQINVAKRLGISQPTYAECERGNNMRIGTMQNIASVLGGHLSIEITIKGNKFPWAL